jgi:hypothetical protein
MLTATLTAVLVLGDRPSSKIESGLVGGDPLLSETDGPLFDATALDLPPTLTAALTAVATSGLRSVRSVAPGRPLDVLPLCAF